MSHSQMMVQLEYLGSSETTFSIRSRSPFPAMKNIYYRFSKNPPHKIATVILDDAERLLNQVDSSGNPIFRIVSNGDDIYAPDLNNFGRDIHIGSVSNKSDVSKVKCQHCGQYGFRQSSCEYCGSPMD